LIFLSSPSPLSFPEQLFPHSFSRTAFPAQRLIMPYTSLLLDIQDGIATVTLNRPDKRNSFNAPLIAELRAVFAELASASAVRVIVLAGAGKVFCAGMDLAYLQDIAQFSVLENMADSQAFRAMLHGIYTCPKPVIAKVHGAAIAGGCGLASVCDLVLAGRDKALFGYSEVKIGFVPAIVSVYLVRKIGDTAARRLLLSAENINATEAARLGLITHVVADDELDTITRQTAQTLAANSSSGMALTKQLLADVYSMSLEAALNHACSMNAVARTTDDFKRGIASFLDKSDKADKASSTKP
jgi:methylglutaconyl-CoA hydratase